MFGAASWGPLLEPKAFGRLARHKGGGAALPRSRRPRGAWRRRSTIRPAPLWLAATFDGAKARFKEFGFCRTLGRLSRLATFLKRLTAHVLPPTSPPRARGRRQAGRAGGLTADAFLFGEGPSAGSHFPAACSVGRFASLREHLLAAMAGGWRYGWPRSASSGCGQRRPQRSLDPVTSGASAREL